MLASRIRFVLPGLVLALAAVPAWPQAMHYPFGLAAPVQPPAKAQRVTEVYKLRWATAPDVAVVLQTYLTNERAVLVESEQLTPHQQLLMSLVVSPATSNQLILGGSPEGLDILHLLIAHLDQMPPEPMKPERADEQEPMSKQAQHTNAQISELIKQLAEREEETKALRDALADARRGKKSVVCKIYKLHDLGHFYDNLSEAETAKLGQWIADTLCTIAPDSWQAAPLCLPNKGVLIVHNTPAVIAQVDDFLENLKSSLSAHEAALEADQKKRIDETYGVPKPAEEGQLVPQIPSVPPQIADGYAPFSPGLPPNALPGDVSRTKDSANSDKARVIYTRKRSFLIPFQLPANSNIHEVKLYVSADEGHSWLLVEIAPADSDKRFHFTAPCDGAFWFNVATVDSTGRIYPPDLHLAQPQMKVIVDTIAPHVVLTELPRKDNTIGVRWNVEDTNLGRVVPDAFHLECLLDCTDEWHRVDVEYKAGEQFVDATGILGMRVRVRDLAGNWGEASILFNEDDGPSPQTPDDAEAAAKGPAEALAAKLEQRIAEHLLGSSAVGLTGPERIVLIRSRSGEPFSASKAYSNGEWVSDFPGGIMMLVKDRATHKVIVDIEADRMMSWCTGDADPLAPPFVIGKRLYRLSGRVVIRQPRGEETHTIRVDEAYYDMNRDLVMNVRGGSSIGPCLAAKGDNPTFSVACCKNTAKGLDRPQSPQRMELAIRCDADAVDAIPMRQQGNILDVLNVLQDLGKEVLQSLIDIQIANVR